MIRHESIEDFRKRYKDAFVFLNFNNKKLLVQYSYDKEGSFVYDSPVYGEIQIDQDTAMCETSFSFPTAGLYNIDEGAFMFTRIPARQWKRAPHKDNCQITSVLQGLFHRKPRLLTCNTLEQVYYTKYPKSLEAAINEDKLTVALNLKFAISASNTKQKDQKILWYKQTPVAYVDTGNRSIIIKTDNLRQEVIDYIKKKESTWTLI